MLLLLLPLVPEMKWGLELLLLGIIKGRLVGRQREGENALNRCRSREVNLIVI